MQEKEEVKMQKIERDLVDHLHEVMVVQNLLTELHERILKRVNAVVEVPKDAREMAALVEALADLVLQKSLLLVH